MINLYKIFLCIFSNDYFKSLDIIPLIYIILFRNIDIIPIKWYTIYTFGGIVYVYDC